MDLNEIRARVRMSLGNPSKQVVPNKEIDLLINDAQIKMVKEGALLRKFKQTMTKTGANTELHTSANAASLTNEANNTTGWTDVDTTIASSTTGAYKGTYGIVATCNADNDRGYIDMTGTVGCVVDRFYKISFYAKHSGTGGDIMIKFASDTALSADVVAVVNLNKSDTEWKKYELILKCTTANRYFGIMENNSTVDGVAYFDAFSVKEVEGYERYQLPSDCLYILRVDYDGDRIPFIDYNELEELEPTDWTPDWS
tara:strand:+ start:620 stop:1387 length:768 start_codon:yes stop_codon:yes gene_type:complete